MSSKVRSEVPKTCDVKHLGISLEKESIWRDGGPLGELIAAFGFVFIVFALFWVVPTFAPAWDHLMQKHHIVKR
jgi:hypothetical protein